jgi:protein dithiol oxidoreductase (disulfide-forming)
MKWLYVVSLITGLLSGQCLASPTQPEEGKDYIVISTPQKTSPQGNRVDVLEFILFHCPHCAKLEPLIKNWAASQRNAATLRTAHATFRGAKDPEVRLFYTLDAMGELDEWRPKIFHSTQQEGVRMISDDSVLEWAKHSGLDSERFRHAWNSAEVISMTAKAPETVKAYGLTYAPAFIVAGKFMTSPSLIKQNNPTLPPPMVNTALFNVLDFLVKHAREETR